MKNKRIVSIAHITAAALFAGFIPLGWLIYPDALNKFFPLQAFASIYLLVARWFTLKAKEEHHQSQAHKYHGPAREEPFRAI